MKDLIKTLSTFVLYIFLPTLAIYVLKNFFDIVLDSNNVEHIIYVNVALDTIFFILFIIINFDVLKNNKPYSPQI